ncbi:MULTISPECIES: ABC transporter substrate-binding protein [unclassified Oceanispirochaeta]|uniref:ABC transporter substrate-binding protein n=1 Tax=unclassified Oceanispirochaeta TaxID=2635722 RepID=UPI000E097883|nr:MULTISPECIES: ABC transporter substrate-binding protein [unclassified Oceanispirochaeta]MBF9016741.1 ABC transporter substrate-binding protein [Oceanispirochaeta sp. M2]NPD72011.1 ABC transporter substrate-binding protein [Oceanispirochaeta sp. M1]RDG32455.1 ABC transporter substrate-binding protein [Oceanispirochaeta sp. M1]
MLFTKKKVLLVLVLSLLCFGTIWANGDTEQTDTGGNTGSNEKSSEVMTLNMFYPVQVGGPLTKLVEKICEDFTKVNPGIIVKPIYTGNYNDTVVKIQTAIQGKNPPELFLSLATQRFSLTSTDSVIALDDMIAADGGDEYINDFLPGFMEDSFVDGKIWSIPFQRSTQIIYYNKDAFKEVGLDPEAPPKNWDELLAFSKKLTKKDSDGNVVRWGVGLAQQDGSAQWQFTGFCLENSVNGENLMSDDGKKVFFNTPENVEALQYQIDLQQKHEVMPKGIVQWTDLPGAFLEGKYGIIYHTTGNLTNISKNADFEFGTGFMPGNKRYGAPTGGGNFYISKGVSEEKQNAAWKFIRFATSPERLAQWNVDTGYVAPRISSFETSIMKNYYANLPQAMVAKDQLKYAKPELTTYDASKMWRIFNDNYQAAIIGDLTPQEALDKAQREGTRALARFQ